MLKIKDNVDLKELEKILKRYDLQFKYSCNEDTGESYISSIQTREKIFAYITIQEIKVYFSLNQSGILEADENNCLERLDLIYDLIKADLVEKVEV